MGTKSGVALKFLQWFFRGIQLLCGAVVLGVYAYFLSVLDNHNLKTTNDVRANAAIGGAAVLYTIIALLLLCCLAGIMFTSFIAIVLDVAFIGAFIYIAVSNRAGATSCQGYIDTPFGRGQDRNRVEGNDGFTVLPSFHTACRLQSAVLAVAIIAIIFFILSILTEIALVRHHKKEKRFGPSPSNGYTSGSGSPGLFNRIWRRKGHKTQKHDDNVLPQHTTPDQLDHTRQSYATETTAVHSTDRPHTAEYKQEAGYGYPAGHNGAVHNSSVLHNNTGNVATTEPLAATPQNYRYGDGVYDRA